jgi:hypothetical protein
MDSPPKEEKRKERGIISQYTTVFRVRHGDNFNNAAQPWIEEPQVTDFVAEYKTKRAPSLANKVNF